MATRAATTGCTNVQKAALAFGVAFLLVGVLGFIPLTDGNRGGCCV